MGEKAPVGECFRGDGGSFVAGDVTVGGGGWWPLCRGSFLLVGEVGETALPDVRRVRVPLEASFVLPLSGL